MRRYTHQVERLDVYLAAVKTPVEERGVDAFEFLLESSVVMMVSFLEEFRISVVKIGAFYREDDVRQYLQEKGSPEEQRLAPTANGVTLGRLMATRVSFKKQARRLETVFEFLFDFAPWSDQPSARLIRDLVRVRNVIVHAGGWPNETHFKEMETPNVIRQTSKDPDFFALRLVPATGFVLSSIRAAGMMQIHLQNKFSADPRWLYQSLIKPFDPSTVQNDE